MTCLMQNREALTLDAIRRSHSHDEPTLLASQHSVPRLQSLLDACNAPQRREQFDVDGRPDVGLVQKVLT